LLVGLLTMCFLFSSAQNKPCDGQIKGQILDLETSEPIAYATVQIEGTGKGVSTDQKGIFLIQNVCDKEIHLQVNHVGYKPIVHHHDLRHPEPVIYLASEAIELEGLVVEEEASPSDIKSLSAETQKVQELASFGLSAGEISESLSGVSSIRTGQNLVKPIVHGLHSNRVLILNNGVRHAYQAWGRAHAPEIDVGQVDKLKLIKGAATVRYGPEALGGVILYDPVQPKFDQKLTGIIGTGFQSNGRGYSGRARVSKGFHRLALQAGVQATRQGDLHTPDYELTNSGKNELSFHFAGRLHRPSFDLSFYASRFDQELGILRGSVVGNIQDLANAIGSEPPAETRSFSYEIRNPRQETEHDLYKFLGVFYPGDHEIELQYAYQQNLRREFDIRRGTNNQRPAINLKLQTHTIDAAWQYPTWKNVEATLGVQLYSQNNDNIPGTNTIPFVPNYNIANAGIFSIHSYNTGSATFELGMRYDYQYINARGRDAVNNIYRNTLNYHNFTFNLGYKRQLSEELSIRTNIGSAWRPPKVGELYLFGKHQFNIEYGLWRYQIDESTGEITTQGVLGNDEKPIKSERGLKWIGALEWSRKDLQTEWVVYAQVINNFFFMRPYGITNTIRGPFPYYIHDQTDAFFTGLDASTRWKHGNQWTSEAKLAYVFARDIQKDQPFLEIPPLNVSYKIHKQIKLWDLSLGMEWMARQWDAPDVRAASSFIEGTPDLENAEIFDFVNAPNGYFLLNLQVQYEAKRFRGSLQINNLLNTSYRIYTDRMRYFADDIGRNIKVAFSYRLSK